MPFNSVLFLIYFIIFTIVYYSKENHKFKLFSLLIFSLAFYAFFNLINLIYLLVTILVTFWTVNKSDQKQNNLYFYIGISFILLQLISAKNQKFLLSKIGVDYSQDISYFNLHLIPIGISFYSLQAISLIIDVKRGLYNGDKSLQNIARYLSFFPQSIAGPIHRANDLIPQLALDLRFSVSNVVIGFKTILWGYFCKLIVADKIAIVVNQVFNSFHDYDGLTITLASMLYSFEIYYDFWGYSLIAIGLGRILGFRININFKRPYSTNSFKEFWRRWHISLSQWMRDYIYIPLGGKNQGNYYLYIVVVSAVFLISGFWHGVTWNFIIWGVAHALLYIAEDICCRRDEIKNLLIHNWVLQRIRTITFFTLLSMTWLVFRTEGFHDLAFMFRSIVSVTTWTGKGILEVLDSSSNLLYICIFFGSLLFSNTRIFDKIMVSNFSTRSETLKDSVFMFTCILLLVLFGDIGAQDFLYFKF